MIPILTVTLNPALDLATSVDHVTAGPKLRCGPETAEPGGGGVNAARAVMQLGGHATALVALGGNTGDALGALLKQQGLDTVRIEAPSETRHSFAVTDSSTGEQYRFVLAGPSWSEANLDHMLDQLDEIAAKDAFVVLSGSMPPGAKPGFVKKACARLGPNRRVVVDTSGAHLEEQAKGPQPAPAVLRMDSHEAQTLSGLPLGTQIDSATYAEELRQKGAGQLVIIARGKDGSVMADGTGLWHVNAANDHVVSAIGAGDSFVGGFVMGLAQGLPATEALRFGAAAASAAVLSEGTQLCRRKDWDELLPITKVTAL
ncbi:1-phosphofructokinase family hexose kinase [Pelagimonas varians]|uniref:Phosphofructokinase n=1 Tax=Pelagimonas varians TaxID=696760 RepID=A0A238K9J0_9RHOB|nr:1-phosphofructokinase family hexose kinase [Pelagimonas varians]PYG31045.1 6-phosphofructokinase [Pelagimonas varians]SMX39519.1 Putative phosphofructokinase PfkB [Pelagimonas varians]